jgi:adhesin transport system membrane fusion protein
VRTQERLNRFRQEASRRTGAPAQRAGAADEQQVVRDDALRRTTLASPVRGIVKSIRNAPWAAWSRPARR